MYHESISSAEYKWGFYVHSYDLILWVQVVLHNSLMSCKGERVNVHMCAISHGIIAALLKGHISFVFPWLSFEGRPPPFF